MMMLHKDHLSAPRRHDHETRHARKLRPRMILRMQPTVSGRARCPKRVPGGLFATMSATSFSVSTRCSATMRWPTRARFCPAMRGANVTRKALFKETAYCQAVWITILEVCPKTLPGFFASGMPQHCDLAPVSNTMRSSLRRAFLALMSPHPRRNGKKIFSLKCSNALHSRARKPSPGE